MINIIYNNCSITSYMYKGWWVGGAVVGGRGCGRWWGRLCSWRHVIPSVRIIWSRYVQEVSAIGLDTSLDGIRDISLPLG